MDNIKKIRYFNRAFARSLHVFSPKALGMEYTLAEVRIIEEIALHENCTANFLCQYLFIDKGYMSHILAKLETIGLLKKEKALADRRKWQLRLTSQGEALFAQIDALSNAQVAGLIKDLSPTQLQLLQQAMSTILKILPERPK